ncbi:hypothetical protein ASPZODRAFT_143644 [Penicilliopsis zonata CBS 506.65]|uniref:Protein BNI4 n=1 Tax=Penicilliopsis zonata CBS 506.65 TaxID=1073090 RepID=A0A1L9SF03_9EURO|nr:hypothetical protein ASPZODRAFT_143644 [Penicilliopsis zonata CBS 506.65]OJJ45759.1 hypothetical protein ASPZODRAFT_143644 [Penicilliopsis zonata CBS 506.65]
MAALVQTIPQQSGTVPVLQTRPSSSHSQHHTTMSWVGGSANPRANAPVAPYAFNSTPNLHHHHQQQPQHQPYPPHLRPEHRALSAPAAQMPVYHHSQPPRFGNHPAAGSVSSTSTPSASSTTTSTTSTTSSSTNTNTTAASSLRSYMSKDDSVLPSRSPRIDTPLRPLSTVSLPPPAFMSISSPTVGKPSPDRYRRGPRRVESGSSTTAATPGTTAVDDLAMQINNTVITPATPATVTTPTPTETATATTITTAPTVTVIPRVQKGHTRVSSADEAPKSEKSQPELAKRYRRRSWATMDSVNLANAQLQVPGARSPSLGPADFHPVELHQPQRPGSAHSQHDSTGSVHSTHSSSNDSLARDSPDSTTVAATAAAAADKTAKSDTGKRTLGPSPLSQPTSSEPEQQPQPQQTGSATPSSTEKAPSASATATAVAGDSLAAQRLSEISRLESHKGKSRLRRAFSFGSSSELLKSQEQSNQLSRREARAAEKLRREQLKEELGPEQAAIAEQQEASGLGESIYSHHQGFFHGSTDNISISSTASSASIMLRKMGKGVKRSTRSLVGLFRPKSIASASPSEPVSTVAPMAPQLSMVNIEADRKDLATNANPQDLTFSTSVFSKVDLSSSAPDSTHHHPVAGDKVNSNSSNNNNSSSSSNNNNNNNNNGSNSRKSIVGGDRERAEVLAAVRKGILKKTHSDPGATASPRIDHGGDSPHSSAPSTPEDQSRPDQRRRDSIKIAGEDYFLSAEGRFAGAETKSAPITPQPVAGRNIVFSPRIQFHETWPSGEYDRRGEIATCNRLTPLLAQQIKEELNTFKMEMEVHETSKIYTHFL